MGADVPEGYVAIRDAIYEAAQVLHAGTEVSAAVRKAREAGVPTDFSEAELKNAEKSLWDLVMKERLSIWMEHKRSGERLRIAPDDLATIPHMTNFRVTDLTYMKVGNILFSELIARFRAPLGGLQLLLSHTELQRRLKELHAKRQKQARRPASSKPIGRPKIQDEVQAAIIVIVESGKWRPLHSAKQLTYLLGRQGIDASDSTVRRAVDDIYQRTDDRRYLRIKKAKRYRC